MNAQQIAQAERTRSFMSPSLHDSHWQYKVAKPISALGGGYLAIANPGVTALVMNGPGILSNSDEIANKIVDFNYADRDIRGFVSFQSGGKNGSECKIYSGTDYFLGGTCKNNDKFSFGESTSQTSANLKFPTFEDVINGNATFTSQFETDNKFKKYISNGVRTDALTGKTRLAESLKVPILDNKWGTIFIGVDGRY